MIGSSGISSTLRVPITNPCSAFVTAVDSGSTIDVWVQTLPELHGVLNRLLDCEMWSREAQRDLDVERREGHDPRRRAAAESMMAQAVGALFATERLYDDTVLRIVTPSTCSAVVS